MNYIKFNKLVELVEGGEITTIIIGAADMQGKLFGKKLPAKKFLEGKKDGIQICAVNLAWDISLNYKGNYDFCNFDTGLHDMNLIPDLSTIRPYPWLEKTAFVMADIQDIDGKDISIAPRNILKKQLQIANDMGFKVQAASELEFFIYKETPESIRSKNFMNLAPLFPYPIDNNLYRMNVDDWFIRKLVENLDVAGVDTESYKGEWGNGQIEINLQYNEGLEMADQTVVYKAGIKEMAIQDQLMATFMAKPVTEDSGSSGHVHMSLCNLSDQVNIFYDPDNDYNLSETGRYFLGGVRELAPEMMLLYAPYVNSYKRFVVNGGAPTTFTWGVDNRTTAFRLAGANESMRIENRIPGADAKDRKSVV